MASRLVIGTRRTRGGFHRSRADEALESLPLAVRRRWPLVCLALASLGFVADQLRGYHSLAGTGSSVALLSAGAHLGRHRWIPR